MEVDLALPSLQRNDGLFDLEEMLERGELSTLSGFLLPKDAKKGLASRLAYKLPGPAFAVLDCVKRDGTEDTGGVDSGLLVFVGRE